MGDNTQGEKIYEVEQPHTEEPQTPVMEPMMMTDEMLNNCAVKTLMGGVGGCVFGFAIGAFISSTSFEQPNPATEHLSTRTKVVDGFKQIGRQSFSTAKNFGLVSLIFSGVECNIEKYRAKTDIYNGILAGCVTGAALGARGGPGAAAVGCAGFSAFSAFMEHFLIHSNH